MMKISAYNPKPIDTNSVILPSGLLRLSETIARNTHDVWSAKRLADGWIWGPVRDDSNKRHPCLIPYDELSEDEKEYDRRTSMETIKLILSLGYEIKPKK